tara:strand:+ start:151 stop:1032 length:882 start_codon:yes stop_codon:yes gene_type:complete
LNDLIFISSGGSNLSAKEFLSLVADHGLNNIELSSGNLVDYKALIKFAKSKNLTIQPHNYFPPNKDNYVINLAKKNIIKDYQFKEILTAQINIAKHFNRKFLHYHAGYCFELSSTDFGVKKLERSPIFAKHTCIKNFHDNTKEISEILEKKGLKLLIENNVVNLGAFNTFGQNPFLCADPDEILSILNTTDIFIGLLLDLAHLKVSSHTLKFDFFEAVRKLMPITSAIHISDNDGCQDTNQAFDEKSDVLQALKLFKNLDFITVEVYSNDLNKIKNQVNLVKKIREIECLRYQ